MKTGQRVNSRPRESSDSGGGRGAKKMTKGKKLCPASMGRFEPKLPLLNRV